MSFAYNQPLPTTHNSSNINAPSNGVATGRFERLAQTTAHANLNSHTHGF